MWVVRGGDPEHPILLYQYHRTRSGKIPTDYLKDYHGYLQTDGYTGYDTAGKSPDIIHVGCWAHARRMFFEAKKATQKTGSAEQALAWILKLYVAEREFRSLDLSASEFVERRKERVEPVLEKLQSWLQKRSSEVPPSTFFGKALTYTLKQWEKLIRYLDQEYLTPDTNLVENAIRPFVLGRKNWLFSGSPRGAYASSTIYSLVETAKANNLEPYRYLRYVFEKIPLAETDDDYRQMLPQNASI